MNATINVVCYKWKVLANGECPLMLRVSKNNKRTMKSLGISVNPKHWDFVKNRPKPSCPNKQQIQKIILAKQKLQNTEIYSKSNRRNKLWPTGKPSYNNLRGHHLFSALLK